MFKQKILFYLFKFIRFFMPKTEWEKQMEELERLKDNVGTCPENYGKIALIYMKLSNRHALLIGKDGRDDHFILAQHYENMHVQYRNLYFDHVVHNNLNQYGNN